MISCVGLNIQVGDPEKVDFTGKDYSGALIQYPNTYGAVKDPSAFVEKAHAVSDDLCFFRLPNEFFPPEDTQIPTDCLHVIPHKAVEQFPEIEGFMVDDFQHSW